MTRPTDAEERERVMRHAKAALHEAADMLNFFGVTDLANKCEERATALRLLSAALTAQETQNDRT